MEFRDLRAQYHALKPEIDDAVKRVMENTGFISGHEVRELEEQLAEYLGVKHCITCGNGTDALLLALMAWEIGKGDAIFVPDFTFFASGEAPALCGATPVFVDVERDTFNMSPDSLEDAIKRVQKEGKLKPKVIVAVDLFGQPAEYDRIQKIAKTYGLLILEDGAQGFGGSIGEKKACSFGDIAATSFFPAKPLGCYGDGGAVFTDNDEWEKLIRSYCVHGKGENKYDNVRLGMNSRLDTMQAAVLQIKLKAFEEYEMGRVNQVAKWYTSALEGGVVTPVIRENFSSSWAQYTVVCKGLEERQCIQKALSEAQIPSMIYYAKGMHEQKAFEKKGLLVGSCVNTDYLKDRVLSLPMHPYMQKGQVEMVADIMNKALN